MGVSISLDGSDINISYQLLEVGVPAGLPLPGTGSPLDFGFLHTGSGVYTVFATNVITGLDETTQRYRADQRVAA